MAVAATEATKLVIVLIVVELLFLNWRLPAAGWNKLAPNVDELEDVLANEALTANEAVLADEALTANEAVDTVDPEGIVKFAPPKLILPLIKLILAVLEPLIKYTEPLLTYKSSHAAESEPKLYDEVLLVYGPPGSKFPYTVVPPYKLIPLFPTIVVVF